LQIKMYEQSEETVTRYIGFVGNHRWDIALTATEHFYGKTLVLNLQNNRFGIIGKDDLEADKLPLLMQTFGLTDEEEGEELREFLLAHL
jgi:hypothetical protein